MYNATTVGYRVHRDSKWGSVSKISAISPKNVFRSFDQLSGPGSLWNHQKWIPREISRRYRSIEIEKMFFQRKIMQNIRCRPSEPRHPLAKYNRKFYSNFWRILSEKHIFSVQKSRSWGKISKIATILLLNTLGWIGSPIFISFRQRNRWDQIWRHFLFR